MFQQQQQQQEPQRSGPIYALPSMLPQGSRDRSDAIAQLRRMKFAIKYSDMYSDDKGLFCHVHLPKGVVPYLPTMAQQITHFEEQNRGSKYVTATYKEEAFARCPNLNAPAQMNGSQIAELGIQFRIPHVFLHVTSFSSEPQVLLFRADRKQYLEARRWMLQQQRQQRDDLASIRGISRSSSSSEDDAINSDLILDPREHVFSG